MTGFKPKGSDGPIYCPHRDLLYRFRPFISRGLRQITAENTDPETYRESQVVGQELAVLMKECAQHTVDVPGVQMQLDAIKANYPKGYERCMHEITKTLFMAFRIFIGEVTPAKGEPQFEQNVENLEKVEHKVETMIQQEEEKKQ